MLRRPQAYFNPRYTMITVQPAAPGAWNRRFPIAGEELIVYPMQAKPIINAIDDHAVPAFDTICEDSWEGQLDVDAAGWVQPVGNLNPPASDTVTYNPGDAMCVVVTAVALPPANLVLGPFTILGTTQPGGAPNSVNVPAGMIVVFPGGAAGVYPLQLPGFSAPLAVPAPPEITFTAAAGLNWVPYQAAGIIDRTCHSPHYHIPSVLDTSALLDGPWGYLLFDDAPAPMPWAIIPGANGGLIARGAMGISCAHPVRARCRFNSFILQRAVTGQGHDLIIQVRNVTDDSVKDTLPT
jgi:hypothetical protein